MPAHRKPDNLKLLHGTWRPDRAAQEHLELPLVEGIPQPPAWLIDQLAVDEWFRLAQILTANRLLTEAALGPLAILCAIHAAIAHATSAGVMPKAALIATYRALAGDFGLTLAAQQKLRPHMSPITARTNPFAEFAKDKA